MSIQCKQCEKAPELLREVLSLYEKGNPLHVIELLTECMVTNPNLSQPDLHELAELVKLLTAIARQRQQDSTEIIEQYKIPA